MHDVWMEPCREAIRANPDTAEYPDWHASPARTPCAIDPALESNGAERCRYSVVAVPIGGES